MSRPPRVGKTAKEPTTKQLDEECPECGSKLKATDKWKWCPNSGTTQCGYLPQVIKNDD